MLAADALLPQTQPPFLTGGEIGPHEIITSLDLGGTRRRETIKMAGLM